MLRLVRNSHFWILAAMFAIVILLQYPQQISYPSEGASFPVMLLFQHVLQRLLLLVPIAYASFIFGLPGGIASLVVALLSMLPQIVFLYPVPALVLTEGSLVLVCGIVINIWFSNRRKRLVLRRSAQEALANIIDGSPIPAFGINYKHRITHWNTALEVFSGIKSQDVIGTDQHWRSLHSEKRQLLADLLVDGVSTQEVEELYRGKIERSRLIDGAFEVEDFFPALGKTGKWIRFTVSPVKDKNGRIVGAIETLADITARKNAHHNLRYYLQQITIAQEEERKRIARELHDDTAQNLIALLHQVENYLNDNKNLPVKEAKALWGFHERVRDILQEVRRFSRDLRPSILDDLGLIPSLDWALGELKKDYGLDTELKVVGGERRLPQEKELLLFRIVQEALINTAKHAHARKAELTVEFAEDSIRVTISDDGEGFMIQGAGTLLQRGKLGLVGMQERIQLLGGTIQMNSQVGKGTTILVEAPVTFHSDGAPPLELK